MILYPLILAFSRREKGYSFVPTDATFSLLLLLVLACNPAVVAAEDTLTGVLQRLRIQDTLHYSYQETRTLQLLTKPWQGNGDLYLSPQHMVIAQQAPTRVTTLITADRLTHIDHAKTRQRSFDLERPFAVPGMEPFMQILYGTAETSELQQDYEISFDSQEKRWQLQLEPRRPANQDIARMTLSGDYQQTADRLVLTHKDNDRTEWQLSLVSRGEAAASALQKILPDHRQP